ncbi:hypothetical protein FEM48_Zijuj06G0091500 [Ziziphus jujuba var. spinosa]|nr:hypothetical protein FEM48_Zijuj06G0091500 [Ziziphus jujuba var. spinosa]
MHKFDSPPSLSSSTLSSSSSSLSSLVSAIDLGTESDELSEIVKLPSLGTSYESSELSNEFVFVDSEDGWVYPPPWMQNVENCCSYVGNELGVTESSVISSSFGSLFWDN